MLLIFATFRCFALWDRLPRVALRLTLGCEPLAPLGRSFFQNALLRGYLNTDLHNAVVLICFDLLNLCEIKSPKIYVKSV